MIAGEAAKVGKGNSDVVVVVEACTFPSSRAELDLRSLSDLGKPFSLYACSQVCLSEVI